MATYETIPKESDPLVEKAATKTPWRRLVAIALVAGVLFAGAALNSKTATAPAALAAYEGSGVTWDCGAPDSYVAASYGGSSGSIESAGFSAKGNGKTLKADKETEFISEGTNAPLTIEIEGQPYAWSINQINFDLAFRPEVVDASSSVLICVEIKFQVPDAIDANVSSAQVIMGCEQILGIINPVVNKSPSATPAAAGINTQFDSRRGTIAIVVFTSPTEWYMSQYPVYVSIYGGSYDGASSISLATAAVVGVAAVMMALA